MFYRPTVDYMQHNEAFEVNPLEKTKKRRSISETSPIDVFSVDRNRWMWGAVIAALSLVTSCSEAEVLDKGF